MKRIIFVAGCDHLKVHSCLSTDPFLFVEVCGEPQPHGLLQRAAPAGVWRGAIAAETQVILPPLGGPHPHGAVVVGGSLLGELTSC